jgi:hypothetical protein
MKTSSFDEEELLRQADAWLSGGRTDQARALVEEGLERTWYPARLHEWLGRYHRSLGKDATKALHCFKSARASGGWGTAIPELGTTYELLGMDLDAYAEFGHVASWDAADAATRAFALGRQATILERWGRPRAALSKYREVGRLKKLDAAARASALASASELESRLLADEKYFPHDLDEAGWVRSPEGRLGDGAPSFSAFLQGASDLERHLGTQDVDPSYRTALGHMTDIVRAGRLGLEYSNVCLTVTARPKGQAFLRRWKVIAAQFSQLHHMLYRELLEREESPTSGAPDQITQLLARGDNERAWAILQEAWTHGRCEMVLCYSGVMESAGDCAMLRGQREVARRHYALALSGRQYHASSATSGGEGMSRMLDVNRVQAKLDEARKESSTALG